MATSASASSPPSADDVARLSQLSAKFAQGVAAFAAAGKRIDGLPWYLLVGETGAGKTELLRRSGIPMALGELPQTGVTEGLNWWHTPHGVVLDVSGRTFMQPIEFGRNSEWRALMGQLAAARPSCPANGLILALPAESLVRDQMDKIEEKARRIARQLELMQRSFGFRLPVYVVATKVDLINGFRSFFDGLDAAAVAQMVGWSTGGSPAAKFESDAAARQLADLRATFLQRRSALIFDAVGRREAAARRIDQLDELYAFPDAFVAVGPRLRRYLDVIFGGAGSTDRPFLRGVYFTSAVRQGAPLDIELAYARGMPVESLPEGRVWNPDRAFFIGDLFLTKIFVERGLAARTTEAGPDKAPTRRRSWTAAAILASLVLIWSVISWLSVRRSNEEARQWWNQAAGYFTQHPDGPRIIQATAGPQPAYRYAGDQVLDGIGTNAPIEVSAFYAAAVRRVKEPIAIPIVFRIAAGFHVDLAADERRAALRRIVDRCIFVPVIDAVRAKMRGSPGAALGAGDAGNLVGALGQLLRVEATAAGAASPDGRVIQLRPLLRYLLDDPDYARYAPQAANLQSAIDAAYDLNAQGDGFPAASLSSGSDGATAAVASGLAQMRRFAATQGDGPNSSIRQLCAALQSEIPVPATTLQWVRDALLADLNDHSHAP